MDVGRGTLARRGAKRAVKGQKPPFLANDDMSC